MAISAIQFSPDGGRLAIASRNGKCYVVKVGFKSSSAWITRNFLGCGFSRCKDFLRVHLRCIVLLWRISVLLVVSKRAISRRRRRRRLYNGAQRWIEKANLPLSRPQVVGFKYCLGYFRGNFFSWSRCSIRHFFGRMRFILFVIFEHIRKHKKVLLDTMELFAFGILQAMLCFQKEQGNYPDHYLTIMTILVPKLIN